MRPRIDLRDSGGRVPGVDLPSELCGGVLTREAMAGSSTRSPASMTVTVRPTPTSSSTGPARRLASAPALHVLEIGCGTGQLTRSLLERGLRVTAVEPGERLVAQARAQLDGTGDVQFVNARLEDASLPDAHYLAVFSASAIHWIDPDVSWRKVADALVDGGTLALISYFGLEEPRSADDQQALRAAMARIAPELAADWPTYRDLDGTLAGVAPAAPTTCQRCGRGSEATRSRARMPHACSTTCRSPPSRDSYEQTAEELNALLGTMSFWARLSRRQRDALTAENHALHQRLGRPIRSSTVACLLTARRAACAPEQDPAGAHADPHD